MCVCVNIYLTARRRPTGCLTTEEVQGRIGGGGGGGGNRARGHYPEGQDDGRGHGRPIDCLARVDDVSANRVPSSASPAATHAHTYYYTV